MSKETNLGEIDISPQAIAAIVSEAVLESYGVVGMAGARFWDRLVGWLRRDRPQRGVEVSVSDAGLIVELYVIVEYGTRISEVAYGVMNRVKFSLERALGVPVAEVNVHVQELRVSNGEQ
ncbi:MAG: Asp23/Gls24 family envelope stress response protein [Anaerolineae bacterium]|nr:Asp23/Gls24 family envelope stress response protein [Anaerolineae bacterium]